MRQNRAANSVGTFKNDTRRTTDQCTTVYSVGFEYWREHARVWTRLLCHFKDAWSSETPIHYKFDKTNHQHVKPRLVYRRILNVM